MSAANNLLKIIFVVLQSFFIVSYQTYDISFIQSMVAVGRWVDS
jgi:uncharacterized sporulation protein YeaH/YhbH (DUF444 family)